MPPNQSPEPTAVGAAVASHAASRRWLSSLGGRRERSNPMKTCSYCGSEYPDDAGVCLIDHTSLDKRPPTWPFPWTAAVLVLGIIANSYVIFISLPFYSSFPIYSVVHVCNVTDEWMPQVCDTACLSFLFGLPFAIKGIIKKRRWIDWLGLILVLLPGLLGWVILKISVFNGMTYD